MALDICLRALIAALSSPLLTPALLECRPVSLSSPLSSSRLCSPEADEHPSSSSSSLECPSLTPSATTSYIFVFQGLRHSTGTSNRLATADLKSPQLPVECSAKSSLVAALIVSQDGFSESSTILTTAAMKTIRSVPQVEESLVFGYRCRPVVQVHCGG